MNMQPQILWQDKTHRLWACHHTKLWVVVKEMMHLTSLVELNMAFLNQQHIEVSDRIQK